MYRMFKKIYLMDTFLCIFFFYLQKKNFLFDINTIIKLTYNLNIADSCILCLSTMYSVILITEKLSYKSIELKALMIILLNNISIVFEFEFY